MDCLDDQTENVKIIILNYATINFLNIHPVIR